MAIHLPNEPFKTRSGLELVPRCEPSTYQLIRRLLSRFSEREWSWSGLHQLFVHVAASLSMNTAMRMFTAACLESVGKSVEQCGHLAIIKKEIVIHLTPFSGVTMGGLEGVMAPIYIMGRPLAPPI